MENTNVSFGKVIRQLREENGISLDQLADITTLSKSYISRIENEQRRNPTIYSIIRLKSALNIDIKTIVKLFSDDEDIKEDKYIEGIDSILISSQYMFGDRVATMEIQLLIRDIFKFLEKYSVKQTLNREDEANLLELADKLRKMVSKSA